MNKYNVIHFGSMGIANGLEYIIETAKKCSEANHKNIQFIFAGTGKTEHFLKQKVNEYQLENIKFLGFLSKFEISELLNLCDISITSFLDLKILHTNSPNKLFDSLAAGKACFVNSAGWTKELVENIDFTIENGRYVFSEWYHLKRARCCGNDCRHCAYK